MTVQEQGAHQVVLVEESSRVLFSSLLPKPLGVGNALEQLKAVLHCCQASDRQVAHLLPCIH